MTDLAVGIHVSIAKRIDFAVERAIDVGCVRTFQIFTCSPRRWAAPEIEPSEAASFRQKVAQGKFEPYAHMPYMPNIASPDKTFYSESVKVLIREIRRCTLLNVNYLVVHFGSHMSSSVHEGHRRVIEACRMAIEQTADSQLRILLETSAGIRNSIGSKFEYVQYVLEGIKLEDRMGVCFDTCHVFSSGYDLRTQASVEDTIENFDKTIGIDRLFLVHVNDSKGELGSGRDRHEHIGLGKIGDEGFVSLFAQSKIRNTPLVLETPIDEVRDDRENVAHTKKILLKARK